MLVTGDSHTEGVCGTQETFPNVLEALLRERHPDEQIEAQEIPAGKSSEEVIGAAITAGNAPCLVFNTSPAAVPQFEKQGGLVSLSSFEGGDDYITKPVKRPVLRDALRRWTAGRETAAPVLDMDALKVATGGDEQLIVEVLAGLEQELVDRRAQLAAGSKAGDYEAAAQAARALGAVCASVGAHALRAACQGYAHAGPPGSPQELSARTDSVLQACTALEAALAGRDAA